MGTIYITVHGTGDADAAPVGAEPKWWAPTSDFCTELLAAAPAGSRVEPFVWSGANDEMQRRAAAERLLKRLRAGKGGDPIVLIGHSHGGSVIATALKFAAAKKDALDHVTRWVTVGTPFIRMRRKWFPWEKYNIFGQAIMSFAVLLFFMIVIHVISFFVPGLVTTGAFGQTVLYSGTVGFLFCAGLLNWAQRRTNPLHSLRVTGRFKSIFVARWRGVCATRDEATASLSRLPMIRIRLFDWTMTASAARALVTAIIGLFVSVYWVSVVNYNFREMLYEQAPSLSAAFALHERFDIFLLNQFYFRSAGTAYDLLTDVFGEAVGSHASLALYPITLIAAYLAALSTALLLTNLIVRLTVGRAAAVFLNRSLNAAIQKKAYGETTVGERAIGASTSPFDGSAAAPFPDDAEAALAAYARAHAADLLAGVHEELFRDDRVGKEDMLAEAILEKLTWRELVHTAYFKVPESRRHIVALAAGAP